MSQNIHTAGILVIGNEILDGIVQDTNSNWIELRLSSIGICTTRLVTVRDDLDEISRGIEFLSEAANLIITSGGLGPTHDDMTLQAVARAFDLDLVEDSDAEAIVKRQYKMLYEKGIVDSPDYFDSRKKMALIPKGAIALDNRVGGAPGIRLERDTVVIFCLPGVPAEMKFIFEDSIVPWLEQHVNSKYYEEIVEFPAHDESVFAPYIDKAMRKNPGVYIKSMPKRYGTTKILRVWVSARGEDTDTIKDIVRSAIRDLSEMSGLDVVSTSEK